jgi:hypothetical protein
MLEVVGGPIAYRHDGGLVYKNSEVFGVMRARCPWPFNSAYVAVADLDADKKPEIVVSTRLTTGVRFQWLGRGNRLRFPGRRYSGSDVR